MPHGTLQSMPREWGCMLRAAKIIIVLVLALLQFGTGCSDENFWVDKYGCNCTWYALHDPGCTRFVDLGQRTACNKSCGRCTTGPDPPDPLKTSCSITDLCKCFKGCSPTALCPVSDEAQACQMVVVGGEVLPIDLQQSRSWVELRLTTAEEVHGLEVHGAEKNYARTLNVSWASAFMFPFKSIDNGRLLPANWEGGHKTRVLFNQGPVQAGALRLYPKNVVGQSPPPLSASLLVRRCFDEPPGPGTSAGKCLALKCRAYCYRSLNCDGGWVDYCEQQRRSLEEACDVACSSAHRQYSAPTSLGAILGSVGLVAVLTNLLP